VAGEIKRGIAALKLEGNTKGEAALEFEFDVEGANIKVNPVKYVKRFVQFAPKFVDHMRGPADAARQELATVKFNPTLIAAAMTNNAAAWIKQMQAERAAIEKKRRQVISKLVMPLQQELDFRKRQTQDMESSLAAIGRVEADLARTGAERKAAWSAFRAKPASRPLPPPQPQDIDAYAGDIPSFGGGGSGGGTHQVRESEPRTRDFNFHSPTFDYLKSGRFGKGL
jgi:hypothetical protein